MFGVTSRSGGRVGAQIQEQDIFILLNQVINRLVNCTNAIFPTIIVNTGLNCAPDHSILFLKKITSGSLATMVVPGPVSL